MGGTHVFRSRLVEVDVECSVVSPGGGHMLSQSDERSCLESVELCFDTQKRTGRDAGARSYRAMEGE